MILAATIIWGSILPLYLAHRGLLLLGHLGEYLLQPQRRNLNRRLARNQARLSLSRPQIRRRPLSLPSRNGRKPEESLNSSVRTRGRVTRRWQS